MEEIEYRTIERVTNVLLFVKDVKNAGYNEQVEIELETGKKVSGQVLATNEDVTIIQVFGETTGMNTQTTKVRFKGTTFKMPVSMDMVGRVFDGLGRPRDGGIPIFSDEKMDINGSPINPYAREEPSEFVQTGISSIDCMNTLVRGQKLPIFSGSGLAHNKLAAQIVKQAKILAEKQNFYVVFGGIGINSEDANFFVNEFQNSGALERSVIFLNLAAEPSMERVILPRLALTAAEYLAYEKNAHVMVILTDMTNYAEALREISAARDEVPGRRGYPGYMYTDLAGLFERAGKVKGKEGSVTQLPILTMPSDDITHPIPDLTGYITEGQVVLSRALDKSGIYPGVDVLLSLSRLMNQGIGKDSTREDHRSVSDQLYAAYAKGKELRSLTEIVGEDALSKIDKQYLHFAEEFETRFIKQGFNEDRSINETLDLGWELLSSIDKSEMKRIKPEFIEKYGKWKQI
ncbi:MAG: V-type ATP synthase subunit B [Candidatus Parvarchaeota archaeon]|jgi:V/A-type H+-transporting ATPase subunit B|nr:V-type ATP synthase subunit B [Candidatus Parvarchaeota archaeon]MCL5106561.1 V-type ATP synthase subunit B [Candidatus Parvarchaeota archaeon]